MLNLYNIIKNIKWNDKEIVRGLFLLYHETSSLYFIEVHYARCIQLMYTMVNEGFNFSIKDHILQEISKFSFDELNKAKDVVGIFYLILINMAYYTY